MTEYKDEVLVLVASPRTNQRKSFGMSLPIVAAALLISVFVNVGLCKW